MIKSSICYLIAILLIAISYVTPEPLQSALFSCGLFSLAGSLTNWLAIHMLFEKIPGIYGSGVIVARFDEFRTGLHQLIIEQFFTPERIERFIADMKEVSLSHGLSFDEVIDNADLSPIFDSLTETIEKSSLGGLLAAMGGVNVITPLKDPFIINMKRTLKEITRTSAFQQDVQENIITSRLSHQLSQDIEYIVNRRLEELGPEKVKDIIQTMIRKHLGWLIIWGAVFGGVIGLVSNQLGLTTITS